MIFLCNLKISFSRLYLARSFFHISAKHKDPKLMSQAADKTPSHIQGAEDYSNKTFSIKILKSNFESNRAQWEIGRPWVRLKDSFFCQMIPK